MNDTEMRAALEGAGKMAEAKMKGRKLRASYSEVHGLQSRHDRGANAPQKDSAPLPQRVGGWWWWVGGAGALSGHTHQGLMSSTQGLADESETDEGDEDRQHGKGSAAGRFVAPPCTMNRSLYGMKVPVSPTSPRSIGFCAIWESISSSSSSIIQGES